MREKRRRPARPLDDSRAIAVGAAAGAAGFSPEEFTSHGVLGRLRCSDLSSSWRWCASWKRFRRSFSKSLITIDSAAGSTSGLMDRGRGAMAVRCISRSVSRSSLRKGS